MGEQKVHPPPPPTLPPTIFSSVTSTIVGTSPQDFYLDFLTQQDLLIFSKKMLMLAELRSVSRDSSAFWTSFR